MKVKKIFLTGFPGCGKTTAGTLLSKKLNLPFIDLDAEIVRVEHRSVSTIFEREGQAYFRKTEHEQLLKVIEHNERFVLAVGGGVPCFFDNMEVMNRSGLTIFLDTPLKIIKERLKEDTTRPLMKENTPETLYDRRIKWYKQAKIRVDSYESIHTRLFV